AKRREARTTADGLQGAVAVGIAARGTAGRAGIKVTMVFAVQPAAVELQAAVQSVAGAQLGRQFTVAIGIRLKGIGRSAAIGAGVDTVGGLAGNAHIEPAVALAAG